MLLETNNMTMRCQAITPWVQYVYMSKNVTKHNTGALNCTGFVPNLKKVRWSWNFSQENLIIDVHTLPPQQDTYQSQLNCSSEHANDMTISKHQEISCIRLPSTVFLRRLLFSLPFDDLNLSALIKEKEYKTGSCGHKGYCNSGALWLGLQFLDWSLTGHVT